MKAILHTKYGPPDLLRLGEVEKPNPKDNEVLIKIKATTVSTGDCNVRDLTFAPKSFKLPARIYFGVTKPRKNILGIELSGTIEAVGKSVTRFKVGDDVFGMTGVGLGGHAEYQCMREDGALALKPVNLSYEQAAGVPFGATTALFFLRNKGNVQPGKNVLIYGASGSIGTAAVQLAKYFGAEVAGVCSTGNIEMVKSLGASRVFDYTKEDFTKSGETYDIIFDVVGKTSFSRCKASLKPRGVFLACVMEWRELFQMLWTSVASAKKVKGGVALETAEDMMFFQELFETGKMKVMIDKRYPLEQAAEAFRYVEQGHKKGSVVLTVADTIGG